MNYKHKVVSVVLFTVASTSIIDHSETPTEIILDGGSVRLLRLDGMTVSFLHISIP